MKWRRLLGATILAATAASAYVLACGPFLTEYRSVRRVYPPHLDAYREGRVGVVRPRFARRYLVQAYRRFTGQPALAPLVDDPPFPVSVGTEETPAKQWLALRSTVVPDAVAKARDIFVDRRLPDYQSFTNCLDDAFVTAIKTGKARIAQYGAESSRAREWFTAQDTVFENCDGKDGSDPILPAPAPAGADATARADREYQMASAYFYAMRYEEAAKRFRAIASDALSPWRPYGHYLAARALIRNATVPAVAALDPYLVPAAEDLRRTLNDPSAAALHTSARGLLDLIAVRARPIARLRELSLALATSPTVTHQQVTDYRRLMDRLLGDTEFDYASIGRHEAIAESSDLNDWILAMQGTGQAAMDRILARWRVTGQVQWLIAALWQVPPAHSETAALLGAAAAVRRTSPAFPTVSFLRARTLFLSGDRRGAWAALAGLPRRPAEGFEAETINLLAALRMALAPTFDDLLQNAPRTIVATDEYGGPGEPPPADAPPVFDEDAALVFSQQLPLARLVEASTRLILPWRFRLRIAGAAFTRATMLKDHDAMLAVAPHLRTLAPSLQRDIERVEKASSPAQRHIAAIRLLLRTPGLRGSVSGREDHIALRAQEPPRTFDHTFRRNWWCSFAPDGPERAIPPDAEILTLVYGTRSVPPPAFLTAAERTTTERELTALAALGPAPNYLAAEAVKWARANPADLDAAEALAHAVEGTRWGCTDAQTTAWSRTAFQTLHKLFPKSEWARKTKYWY